MRTNRARLTLSALVLPLVLAASRPPHLELVDSHPKAEETVSGSPGEIWLRFSVEPDREQTSFSVRGPDGNVALGTVRVGDEPEVIRASVEAPLTPGEYTLSWVGAPADDHPVRGRFGFTVAVNEPAPE